jgi:hypothetical protein
MSSFAAKRYRLHGCCPRRLLASMTVSGVSTLPAKRMSLELPTLCCRNTHRLVLVPNGQARRGRVHLGPARAASDERSLHPARGTCLDIVQEWIHVKLNLTAVTIDIWANTGRATAVASVFFTSTTTST